MRRTLVSLSVCVGVVLAVSACVPGTETETETTEPSTTAPTSSMATVSPTASMSTPSPTPTLSESPTSVADPFPASALADVCVTGALESGARAARADIGAAQREQRGDGLWSVAVPGITEDQTDVIFLCTLSGNKDQFQLELRTQVDGKLDGSWPSRLSDLESGRG